MRIAVCGSGGHGKQAVSRLLSDLTGLRYEYSSSQAGADLVYEKWGQEQGYAHPQECWDDRRNHRAVWASIIDEYNRSDRHIRIYLDMMADNDIIDGIRFPTDMLRCYMYGVVSYSVWVDASKRLPTEGKESMTITSGHCDYVLDNNGPLADLPKRVRELAITMSLPIARS